MSVCHVCVHYVYCVWTQLCLLVSGHKSTLDLFSVDFVEDLEDFNEQVDDVKVELDGGQDVLLRADSGHDHLSQTKHDENN